MIPYQIYKQSKNLCGPASLKTVFDFLNIQKAESQWQKLSGATTKEGTSVEGMIEAIRSTGFHAIYKKNSSVEELIGLISDDQCVIVNYWQKGVGHYSPVADIDNTKITIADVSTGTYSTIPIHIFERNWFDFETYPPRSNHDLLLRCLICIKK